MRRIIVGIDGSEASLGALEWAAALAAELGASIVVAHALRPAPSEKRPGLLERLLAERDAEVRSWVTTHLEATFADLDVIVDVAEGEAQDKLPDAVRRHDGDLLVVATVGESGADPGPLSFGSVVEHLARNTTTSLAVVPPADEPARAPARVLLAVDGSEHAKAAARWLAAAELQRSGSSSILAITVDDTGGEADHLPDASWIDPLDEAGVTVESRTVTGQPIQDAILAAAEGHDADLIVLGTRGAGGFAGLRLGGVALEVVRRSPIPVVLVPPDHDG